MDAHFTTCPQASLFSFQLRKPPLGDQADSVDVMNRSTASIVSSAIAKNTGLDSFDIGALDALQLHFAVRWPLQLTIGHTSLRNLEQVAPVLA